MNNDAPTWIVMPVMANEVLTLAALSDCLSQYVPVRVLLIGQGIHGDWRGRLEALAEQEPRLLCLWHDPPLPSLAASWNRALRFVWETGGTEALVVNNDVRLSPLTVGMLQMNRRRSEALFISAVGVTGEQFDKWQQEGDSPFLAETTSGVPANSKGGPDFSCFLISRVGHDKYPFDESFIPAYCEDLDLHRRYMLGGDGERIFSINLPFHHVGGGSGTIKALTAEQRAGHERRIGQSRAYYASAWGGPVNQERYTIKHDPRSAQDGVTTPELQAACMAHETT